MDLGLIEYALWVTFGLWATLFVQSPIAKAAGLLLIILAVLRGLTEKPARALGLAAAEPETVAVGAGEAPAEGGPAAAEPAAPEKRKRRRVL